MLGFPLAPTLLFAQARIEAMPPVVPVVKYVNDSSRPWLTGLTLATIAIAVVACIAMRIAQRRRNHNWQLFRELCHANQLSRSQSRVLRKLSKRLQIANPSRLFLETELWGPVQADPRATSKSHQALHRLREQLFIPVASASS